MTKNNSEHKTYMRLYFQKRRSERRAKAIKFLGGACKSCGNTEGLQFDHIVHGSRKWLIANILAYNEKKIVV